MGRNSNTKKRRLGSDEYTIDLEKRVLDMEQTVAKLTKLYEELKEKNERIAELEIENRELKMMNEKNCLNNLASGDEVNGGVEGVTREGELNVPVEIVEKDLLIIGDSIVDSVDPLLSNPDGGSTVVCVRGATPKDILAEFEKQLESKRFKRIIVHAGTNLVPIFSKEYAADQIIETMFAIKKLAPNSNVAFSSIIPKYNDSWLPDLHYINHRVARSGLIVPKRLSYGFCDHLSRFVDVNGKVDPGFYKKDSIHLSSKGSVVFNKSLKVLIDKK